LFSLLAVCLCDDSTCPQINNQTFTGLTHFVFSDCENQALRVYSSTFIQMHTNSLGGAIAMKEQQYTAEITECTFIHCNATTSGGAFYIYSKNNTIRYICCSFCKAEKDQAAQMITTPDGLNDIQFVNLYSCGNIENPSETKVSSFSCAGLAHAKVSNFNNTGSSILAQGAGILLTNCQNLSANYNTFFNITGSNVIYYFYGTPYESHKEEGLSLSLSNGENNGQSIGTMRRFNIYGCTTTGVGVVYFNTNLVIDKCVFVNNTGHPYIGLMPQKYPDAYLNIYNSKFDIDMAAIINDHIIIDGESQFGIMPKLWSNEEYTPQFCPNGGQIMSFPSKIKGLRGSQIMAITIISVVTGLILICSIRDCIVLRNEPFEDPEMISVDPSAQ